MKIEEFDLESDKNSFRDQVTKKCGDFYKEQTNLFFNRASVLAKQGNIDTAISDAEFALSLCRYANMNLYAVLYLLGLLCQLNLDADNVENAQYYFDIGMDIIDKNEKDYNRDLDQFLDLKIRIDEVISRKINLKIQEISSKLNG